MAILLCLWIIAKSIVICTTLQVTLLDTTSTDSLNWVTYQGESKGRGWREASYTDANGDVFRVYTVCQVDVTSVDNWIRTPYIPRGDANRIYVEVKFTMRKCTKYPDPGRLQQCKESFKLLYYEADSDIANAMRPTWDEDTYRHVDVIAANRVFTDNNDALINTELRSIPVTQNGVYFAFYDQGGCPTFISIRIYFIMCESIVVNYAIFPNTTTGPDLTSIVQKDGVCVDHAVEEQMPSYLCKGDGNWYFPTGRCKCMSGYEPDSTLSYCTACPLQMHKWNEGGSKCLPCPTNSKALSTGSDECQCIDGYYRGPNDDKTMPCTQPPSKPEDLLVIFQDQTRVELSWDIPSNLGGRKDVWYRLECIGCDSRVVYMPQQTGFNSTRASVIGLRPSSEYKFVVYAENSVSEQSDIESSSSVDVVTDDAVPPKVANLRIVSIGADNILLAWDSPREPHIDAYDVTFYAVGSNENASTVYTKYSNITFQNLMQQTKYSFQVRGKTDKSWGEYSDTISATTGIISQHPAESPLGIIAGSAIAVLLCILVIIVMVVILMRRNRRSCNEKNANDCDVLQYNNVHCPHILDGSHIINGTATLPLYSHAGSIRTYVDPYTYEDPSLAVREFTKEIDASFITIESVIGGGEFGDVCKGQLRLPEKPSLTVAIKTLKGGASDKNRLDFLTEASIMGQFDDPNVIYLEGVVTRSNPIMIVTEFMENGSLDAFLRSNDGKFTIIQLVGMLRGIASGMRYLSEMGYVHRDLAARNILVSETLVCKVADFGLSREIESDNMDGEYTTKGGKIPVRWTAPEAIAYRKFTSASDVWSYGVVTWEVVSYGERPYWNWSNQDVIKAVDHDFTLPPPMDCPDKIYQLMLDCWQKDRVKRPKFSSIVKALDKLIRAPELLRPIAMPGPNRMIYTSSGEMSEASDSIDQWLTSIKMERYVDNFKQAGLTSMDKVVQMTLKDLIAIGVTLIGHQKKIINSIQALHAQVHGARSTDGCFV